MVFLSECTIRKHQIVEYPFSVPSIKGLDSLRFTTPITYFIGENGSGKSTLLEGLAAAAGSYAIGSRPIERDSTLEGAKLLAKQLKLSWSMRSHNGFFIRSEDVFGFARSIAQSKRELEGYAEDFSKNLSGYGRSLARGAVLGQKRAYEERYGKDLDANSHGETFLKIFQSRFVPKGLYLLDEPEAPLSFTRQLSLVYMLRQMVAQDSQFIIATHSPILTAMPEATIYSFDDGGLKQVKYEEIESFQLMKQFLDAPESFLRHVDVGSEEA